MAFLLGVFVHKVLVINLGLMGGVAIWGAFSYGGRKEEVRPDEPTTAESGEGVDNEASNHEMDALPKKERSIEENKDE
ncbi:MAG: hypothetical protein Q6370_023400 [Candidatus Sigynarchaeota archaeon]